jgi:transcription-repair coupling factor (superfamily II helicase)
VLRALEQIEGASDAERALEGLRDRFGRVPEAARALVDAFRLRALALPLSITRLAWRADRYVVEFRDRVALEACFAERGAGAELRHLRTGVAHLLLPEREREPARALRWLEAQLERHHERERRLHGADAR